MHDAAAMKRELGERRGREEKRRPLSTLDRPPVSLTILHLEANELCMGIRCNTAAYSDCH
jgi:hypothetical protein